MSVRHALLGLLAQRPRHGYELHAAFEAVAGGEQIWDIKPAQVYTTLSRLEKEGLVAEEGVAQDAGPERRVYAITDSGRRELGGWFSSAARSDHQRHEFFLKLMISLATGEGDPTQMIYVQRASLYRELHTVTSRRSKTDPRAQLTLFLLLDLVVMHLEAELRWLEMVEARLDDIRRQPVPEPEGRPRGRPPRSGR